MRLALAYSLFNGEELLVQSVKHHYDLVDVVIVCYQTTSNIGNPRDLDQTLTELGKMKRVHLIEYKPDLSVNPKENERRKLQARINYCKSLACTHYIGMGCDHFYQEDQFAEAIKMGEFNDVTLSKMYTYYKRPTWQLDPIEDYYCPFICKIYPTTTVVKDKLYNVKVDPSERIAPADTFYYFRQDELMLHHYSMVRADIRDKFTNAAAAQNWPQKIEGFVSEWENAKLGDSISYFKGRKLTETPNRFGLTLPFSFS